MVIFLYRSVKRFLYKIFIVPKWIKHGKLCVYKAGGMFNYAWPFSGH